jgi:hypothetical protein
MEQAKKAAAAIDEYIKENNFCEPWFQEGKQ